jgi:hypothetical protein
LIGRYWTRQHFLKAEAQSLIVPSPTGTTVELLSSRHAGACGGWRVEPRPGIHLPRRALAQARFFFLGDNVASIFPTPLLFAFEGLLPGKLGDPGRAAEDNRLFVNEVARLSAEHYRCTAIAEISIFTSRGRRATSTVARAGGPLLKNVA